MLAVSLGTDRSHDGHCRHGAAVPIYQFIAAAAAGIPLLVAAGMFARRRWAFLDILARPAVLTLLPAGRPPAAVSGTAGLAAWPLPVRLASTVLFLAPAALVVGAWPRRMDGLGRSGNRGVVPAVLTSLAAGIAVRLGVLQSRWRGTSGSSSPGARVGDDRCRLPDRPAAREPLGAGWDRPGSDGDTGGACPGRGVVTLGAWPGARFTPGGGRHRHPVVRARRRPAGRPGRADEGGWHHAATHSLAFAAAVSVCIFLFGMIQDRRGQGWPWPAMGRVLVLAHVGVDLVTLDITPPIGMQPLLAI